MRILLIEDEAPAARRITRMVQALRPGAEVVGPCDTVASAKTRLTQAGAAPFDLLLCDIRLADGLSFRLWEETEVDVPVIFVTAYEQYALRAFRVNSVDYLLKPIEEAALAAAFERLEERRQPALPAALIAQLTAATEQRAPSYRTRLLVTRGTTLIPLRVDDLAHFFSEDRLTFALARDGQRYCLTEPISRLAEELDPAQWYRINRAQLVHLDAVARAEPYLNARLKLSLTPAGPADNVVARERVAGFRAWLGGR